MNILNQLYVMVTRPGLTGMTLCHQIQQAGGQSIHFPTIAFAPIQEHIFPKPCHTKLEEQDWLIFISPQAVYASMPKIAACLSRLIKTVQFASIGASTAKILRNTMHVKVLCPETEWNSEGLLNLPDFQWLQGQKIMLIKGEGGRELLKNTLIARGALVSEFIAYKRIIPSIDTNECLSLLHQNIINVIVGSSFEGIKYLKMLVGQENWSLIASIPLIVMSDRIKLLAHHLGFQTIWVTQNGTHASTMAMLAQIRKK
jgi:uroporphyrinogen-III synthase